MQIDDRKLRMEVRDYGITKMALALGIHATTLTKKLKSPTTDLYVDEYWTICSLLNIHRDDLTIQ